MRNEFRKRCVLVIQPGCLLLDRPFSALRTHLEHGSLPSGYYPALGLPWQTAFATTYAVLASRRAYDFVHQVIAEEKLNVKIVCALPGLSTGYGPSRTATEDIAIFRGVPNLTIVDPSGALDIQQAVPAIAAHQGPVYMRLLRGRWIKKGLFVKPRAAAVWWSSLKTIP